MKYLAILFVICMWGCKSKKPLVKIADMGVRYDHLGGNEGYYDEMSVEDKEFTYFEKPPKPKMVGEIDGFYIDSSGVFKEIKISQQPRMIEPPGGFEIMKWFWTKFPKTYNGWAIEFQEGWKMLGYTEGTYMYKVNATCDTCNYLPKYSFDIIMSYGYEDGTYIRVKQNQDSTNKYFK